MLIQLQFKGLEITLSENLYQYIVPSIVSIRRIIQQTWHFQLTIISYQLKQRTNTNKKNHMIVLFKNNN
ncbi:hypothetical protein pb186bvf_004776 [Paramecium bursaria]